MLMALYGLARLSDATAMTMTTTMTMFPTEEATMNRHHYGNHYLLQGSTLIL
jgi:hypothetical protein